MLIAFAKNTLLCTPKAGLLICNPTPIIISSPYISTVISFKSVPRCVKLPARAPCIIISPSPVLPITGLLKSSVCPSLPAKPPFFLRSLSNPKIVHSYSNATFCGLLETLFNVSIVGEFSVPPLNFAPNFAAWSTPAIIFFIILPTF